MKSIHIIVSGRVQGVFFRYFTKQKASDLGIVGTVENLSDGRVQIYAAGPSGKIKEFIDWCYTGSPASRVDSVEIKESSHTDTWEEFVILR